MTRPSSRPLPSVLMHAAVLVATVTGGAAGAALVSSGSARGVASLLFGLGLVAGLGMLAVLLLDRGSEPADRDRWREQRRSEPPARRPAPDAAPVTGGRPTAPDPAEPVSAAGPGPQSVLPDTASTGPHLGVAHPVPSRWWEHSGPPGGRANAGSAPDGTAPPPPAPPPDPATYLDSSRIAQCPSCGSFCLSVQPSPPGYDFGCRDCGEAWSWQRGRPWPVMHSRPSRRATRTVR